MISSSALSVPRPGHGSTHSINTAGLGAGGGAGARPSGSFDWSALAGRGASRSSSDGGPDAGVPTFDLEDLVLLK